MCACVCVCVCVGGRYKHSGLAINTRVRSKPHAFPDFNLHSVCNILCKKLGKSLGMMPAQDVRACVGAREGIHVAKKLGLCRVSRRRYLQHGTEAAAATPHLVCKENKPQTVPWQPKNKPTSQMTLKYAYFLSGTETPFSTWSASWMEVRTY